MARPTVMTPEVVTAIIESIGNGNTRMASVAAAGVGYQTWRDYLKRDEDLQQLVLSAEATAEKNCVEILKRAMPLNWQAAAWWLERRRPQQYGKQEKLHVLRDVARDVSALSDEELAALAYGDEGEDAG
jgi:hypothetical protein